MKNLDIYHDTSKENAQNIISAGFKKSLNGDEYLGSGVYFFIEGVCCPITAGKRWAGSKYKNSAIAVIKAKINKEDCEILDLRVDENIKKFNAYKEFFYEKLKEENIALEIFPERRSNWGDKYKIANFIIDHAEIDVLIKNEHFPEVGCQLEQEQKIRAKVENCTIANVTNQSKILYTSVLML